MFGIKPGVEGITIDDLKALGMVDTGINSVIDAASNMNTIVNGSEQELLQSTLTDINSNVAKVNPPFTYTQSNQGKNIYIDITINKCPCLHLT